MRWELPCLGAHSHQPVLSRQPWQPSAHAQYRLRGFCPSLCVNVDPTASGMVKIHVRGVLKKPQGRVVHPNTVRLRQEAQAS